MFLGLLDRKSIKIGIFFFLYNNTATEFVNYAKLEIFSVLIIVLYVWSIQAVQPSCYKTFCSIWRRRAGLDRRRLTAGIYET